MCSPLRNPGATVCLSIWMMDPWDVPSSPGMERGPEENDTSDLAFTEMPQNKRGACRLSNSLTLAFDMHQVWLKISKTCSCCAQTERCTVMWTDFQVASFDQRQRLSYEQFCDLWYDTELLLLNGQEIVNAHVKAVTKTSITCAQQEQKFVCRLLNDTHNKKLVNIRDWFEVHKPFWLQALQYELALVWLCTLSTNKHPNTKL